MTDTQLQLLYTEKTDLVSRRLNLVKDLEAINNLIHNVDEKIFQLESGISVGDTLLYGDFDGMKVVGFATREEGFKVQLEESYTGAILEIPKDEATLLMVV